MGKYISLAVSNSVSKAEWVQAYEETLRFLKIFPLAERRKVNVKGIDTICLIPTAEKEEPAWWLGKNAKRIGWTASGDYETMQTADDISLFRDFVQGDLFDQEAGDAMLGAIADCMDYSWEDPRFQKVRTTWGRTTSGKPYHIYLLAIACLLEARLGDKIFIYGDITRSQCLRATELINQYLDEPIQPPSRCVPDRFYERVERLPFSTEEKQKIYNRLLLGENADELLIRRLYERGKEEQEYDISDYEDLIRYKTGDTIHPVLEASAKESYGVCQYILQAESDLVDRLMRDTAYNRCKWLVSENTSVPLRDKDWEKIFADIENNREAFKRYYPFTCLRINSEDQAAMIRAMALNDDFFGLARH